MKKKIHLFVVLIALLIFPNVILGQAPSLGAAANFVLFTTNGAITNTGITHLTGHVGSNVGGSTGFGNVDGVMHNQDAASAAATNDLNAAYLQLDAAVATFFPGILLGNGQTLNAGVYSIGAAATMNGQLNLDAQNDPNAVFIIQIEGSFGVNSNSKVNLLNGAQACKVFWKIEGQASIASGATMRGTIVTNNAAIAMSAGNVLEGRALSINGAIAVDAITGYTPLGCLAPILTGPLNPVLGSTECFVLFSGIGDLTNVGVTTATGDIGSNNGTTTGYLPTLVTGTIHPVPDGTTSLCGTDFTSVYNDLIALPYDIELLYPNLFGNNLVLTPHVYLMNGAVSFTDTVFLNAQGNADAVFVFKVYGAFNTSTYSTVALRNGAQAKNVYWMINGAIGINDYSVFNGSIISQGDINLATGVSLFGRALTGVGAVNTSAIQAIMPTSCSPFVLIEPRDTAVCEGSAASFSVSASGSGLNYKWRKGNVDLLNGANISGANTATLLINPTSILDLSNDYNVVVSGSFMPTDTSNYVSLSFGTGPIITTQPSNQIACENDMAAFSVIASGLGLNYQWRKGLVNLTDGGSISGTTTSTLTLNPISVLEEGTDYNVIVSGTCTPNASSNNVSLTVNKAPIINTQAIDQGVCQGVQVSFSVVANGALLSYQWRKGNVNLNNGGSISGANTSTLIINSVSLSDASIDYHVVVSGACMPDAISDSVSLTVNPCEIDLSIVKTASDMEPLIGTNVVFTIAIVNNEITNATGVVVSEVLQSGYSYVSSTVSKGNYDVNTGFWTIGSIQGGSVETMTITAKVLAEGSHTNTASASGIEFESIFSNNQSIVQLSPIDFHIPEGFSPNEDMVNDLFVIRGISKFPSNQFVVFNRWGNQVYEASPYTNNWDGTSESTLNVGGNELPVGTYFYVLDLGNGTDVYKGTIYLNR